MNKIKKPLSILLLVILLFSFLIVPASAFISEIAIINSLTAMLSLVSISSGLSANASQSDINSLGDYINNKVDAALSLNTATYIGLATLIDTSLQTIYVNGVKTYKLPITTTLLSAINAITSDIQSMDSSVYGVKQTVKASDYDLFDCFNVQWLTLDIPNNIQFEHKSIGVIRFYTPNNNYFDSALGGYNTTTQCTTFTDLAGNVRYVAGNYSTFITTITATFIKQQVGNQTFTFDRNLYSRMKSSGLNWMRIVSVGYTPPVDYGVINNKTAEGGNSYTFPAPTIDDYGNYSPSQYISGAGAIDGYRNPGVVLDDGTLTGDDPGVLPTPGFWNRVMEKFQELINGVKAIPGEVVDGVRDMLETAFVPDMTLVESELEAVKTVALNKFPGDLAVFGAIQSVAGWTFQDISINTGSLFTNYGNGGSHTAVLVSAKSINDNISTIRAWTSILWYFLLALYIFNQGYFLIRGTSLISATGTMNNYNEMKRRGN